MMVQLSFVWVGDVLCNASEDFVHELHNSKWWYQWDPYLSVTKADMPPPVRKEDIFSGLLPFQQ